MYIENISILIGFTVFLSIIIPSAFAADEIEGYVIIQDPNVPILEHQAYKSTDALWDDDHVIPLNGITPVYGSIVNLLPETIHDLVVYYRFYDNNYDEIYEDDRLDFKLTFREALEPHEVSLFEVYPPHHTKCYEIWVDYATPLQLTYAESYSYDESLKIQKVSEKNGMVTGKVKNTSAKSMEHVWVRLFKFDENGSFFGTKTYYFSGLSAGATKKFEIQAFDIGWTIKTPNDQAQHGKPASYDIMAFSMTVDDTWENASAIFANSFEDYIYHSQSFSPYYYGGDKPAPIKLDKINLIQNNSEKQSCTKESAIRDPLQKLDVSIPAWTKIRAEWWADGKISEESFIFGIEELINKNIIKIDNIPNHKEKILFEGGYFTIDKNKFNISPTQFLNVKIFGKNYDNKNVNQFFKLTYPDGDTEKIFLNSKDRIFSKLIPLNYHDKSGKYVLEGICKGKCKGNEGITEFFVEKNNIDYVEKTTVIPEWFKTIAKQWSENKISNTEFSIICKYMIEEEIIIVG